MFKNMSAMAKMATELPKIQRIIKSSLEEFSNLKMENDFQNLIVFKTVGDTIKEVIYSEDYIKMIDEDKEMASDVLVSGINSTLSKINETRMQKLEKDAIANKLSPQIVQQMFSGELMNGMM